jgi:phenylalanyl-tRNA synthetase beta chain
MKFTLSWLKNTLDTEADARTIADKLTNIGLEVESIEDAGARLKDFTVAHVISAEKHPNADKLRLCMVNTGAGEPVQVVCGAPNARAGMKAVFARPGTIIPASGAELKIGTIRGVESRGMLCSGRELLLNEDHVGILELPADAKIGEPAASALGLGDPVFDVSITPNRGDCTSVYGIARDLAAAGMGALREGDLSPVAGRFPSPIKTALVFAQNAQSAAPMFAGRMIRGVKNGPSPQWLQDRLKAVGLRPISALVDVTNFLSLDRGRPLHVFDAAKLKGNLCARMAKDGETLAALDGRTYTLDCDMVVIADEEAARGLAGVMGGEDSSCTESTTEVFIESALFDPVRIARAGRLLGILSDARYRFERGVDPEFVLPGLELATKMILEFCGGEPSEIVVAGAPPHWRRTIAFAPADVRRLAGLDLPREEIIRILTKLGFAVAGDTALEVQPPSWRSDVHGAADLVEEVVRIHGLENIPAVAMNRPYAVARAVLTPAQRRQSLARRALAGRGFDETVHLSFIPRARAALFGGGDEARQLENPISADLDAMRPSLLPSLLAAVQRNQARGHAHAMLFEIGAQFESGVPQAQSDIAAGLRAGTPPRHWMKAHGLPDAFTAKADALAALEAAWGGPVSAPVRSGAAPWYHPGRSGTFALGPKVLAHFGELHPRIVSAFDLKGAVAGFEIFLDAIPEPKTRATKARPKLEASDLMAVTRDFAFLVDATVSADQVMKAARNADRLAIAEVELFDVYEGQNVPADKKSLGLAVSIQPKDHTLTEAEIDGIAQKLVTAVTKATGGVLRS